MPIYCLRSLQKHYSLNVESNKNPNILNSNGEMLSLHRIERLDFFNDLILFLICSADIYRKLALSRDTFVFLHRLELCVSNCHPEIRPGSVPGFNTRYLISAAVIQHCRRSLARQAWLAKRMPTLLSTGGPRLFLSPVNRRFLAHLT